MLHRSTVIFMIFYVFHIFGHSFMGPFSWIRSGAAFRSEMHDIHTFSLIVYLKKQLEYSKVNFGHGLNIKVVIPLKLFEPDMFLSFEIGPVWLIYSPTCPQWLYNLHFIVFLGEKTVLWNLKWNNHNLTKHLCTSEPGYSLRLVHKTTWKFQPNTAARSWKFHRH